MFHYVTHNALGEMHGEIYVSRRQATVTATTGSDEKKNENQFLTCAYVVISDGFYT